MNLGRVIELGCGGVGDKAAAKHLHDGLDLD
jgi:hypothetical protein